MSRARDDSSEILSLLSAVCDDAADQESLKRLEELAGQHGDGIGVILDYFQLHFDLRFELASRSVSGSLLREVGRISRVEDASSAPRVCRSPSISHPSSFILDRFESFGGVMVCYLIVVLMVAVGVLAAWRWNPPREVGILPLAQQDAAWNPSEIVGTITRMSGCRWVDPATAPADGAYVHVGRKFALTAGQLEISFPNAYARLLLQGPADFTVKGEDGGLLAFGDATVHTTDRAGVRVGMHKIGGSASLSVLTPTHLVVDRGGDFAVRVD